MYGDLHQQVSTSLITLGVEFRKLSVIEEQAHSPTDEQNLSTQSRTRITLERGDAMAVHVSLRIFFRKLQCHEAKLGCTFYGIAQVGVFLIVLFQFFIPCTNKTYKAISLHCLLYVLDS